MQGKPLTDSGCQGATQAAFQATGPAESWVRGQDWPPHIDNQCRYHTRLQSLLAVTDL
jgi:hypothetical protein